MKALLFIPQLDIGGPDRVFAELAAHLPDIGVEVDLLVQVSGGVYWQKLPSAVGKYVIRSGAKIAAGKAYPIWAFADQVGLLQPDVVLCTLRSLLTASAASILRQIKVPLVIRPANHLTRNGIELLRQSPAKHAVSWLSNILALHAAQEIICQSEDLYRDFRRYGVAEKKLTVIGNPIDLPVESMRNSLASKRLQGEPALIAIGRLMPQKGFDLLIDAVGLLRERMPRLTLRIYGEGPDRHSLDQRIKKLQIADRVTLEGFCDDIKKPLVAADFLVSSSRYEGFPNVVLEALSFGTPVIAADCPGGTGELVIEGKTGWLCQTESAESLAQTIEKASASPRPSPSELRSFVESRYSTKRIVKAYSDVLYRAVAHY